MRLTERKTVYPRCDKQGNLTKVDCIEIKNKGLAEEKLCQLEDIEDELGIDLITFFKIFKEQEVYIKLNNGEIIEGFSPMIEEDLLGIYFTINGKHINSIADYDSYYVSLKDYRKTWALTKEELL